MRLSDWQALQRRVAHLQELATAADQFAEINAMTRQAKAKARARAERLRADAAVLVEAAGGLQTELFERLPVLTAPGHGARQIARKSMANAVKRARKNIRQRTLPHET